MKLLAALLAIAVLSACVRVPDVDALQRRDEVIKNLKRQNENLKRNCPSDA